MSLAHSNQIYNLSFVFSQIEFYFGDANLRHDKFLKSKIAKDTEGCKFFCFIRCNLHPFNCVIFNLELI